MPLEAPAPFESARVELRRVRRIDLPALLEVNADDEVTRFLPYASWRDMADARAWFGRMAAMQAQGTAVQFVVLDKATRRAVGSCLLFRYEAASARAELGYVLGRAHWGTGLMREALRALIDTAYRCMAIRRLEAEVDPRNRRSAQLLRTLGFTHEGLLRQRWVAKGEARDVEVYGLLRQDWLALRGAGASGA